MVSEVLPLEWNQFDFDEVSLAPYSTKDDAPEPREFFFTARMRELLHAQRAYVDRLQKKHGRIIQRVFPTAEGESMFNIATCEGVPVKRWTGYSRSCWHAAQRKSGVLKGTHNLRVTACVERENAGLSIEDTKNAGGWRPDVILRYLRNREMTSARLHANSTSSGSRTRLKPSQNYHNENGN